MKRFFCNIVGASFLVAALAFAGCGDPSDGAEDEPPPQTEGTDEPPPPSEPGLETWDAVAEYLADKPENTADAPYQLKLRGFDFSEHGMFPGVCAGFGDKYVALDLSECAGTVFDSGGAGKGNIVSLILPESLEILPEDVFEGYRALKTVRVSGALDIRDRAFKDCGNLETLSLPPRLTGAVSGAFAGCPNLGFAVREGRGNLTAPGGTSLVRNGNTLLAFAEKGIPGGICQVPAGIRELGEASCAGLNIVSLIIPDSVDKIGPRAFSGCTSLGSAEIHAVSPPDITLSGGEQSFPGTIRISVPAASLEAYKTAWSAQFGAEAFAKLDT